MVVTREQGKARTREKYLRAAARMFADRGFHAVSIDELGAAVGVSGTAFYRHFPGKEALLSEILVGVSERLLAGLEQTLARDLDDRETIETLVSLHLDMATRDRDIIRLQDRELGSLPPDQNRVVRTLQRRYLEGWVDILSRLQPDVPVADLRVRMLAVFGALNSTAHANERDATTDVRRILGDLATDVLLG